MNCSVFCLKDTLCCLCFERYLHWVRSSKLTIVFFCCFKDGASLFPGLHCFKREISCHPTLHSWVHNVSYSLDDFNFFLYHQVLSNVLCALIFFFLMFLVFEFLEILKFVGLLISLHLEIFQHFSSIISSVVSYSPSSDTPVIHTLGHLMLPHTSRLLFVLFFFFSSRFFSFCFILDTLILYTAKYSKSIIFISIMFILTPISFSEFSISTVVFISRSSSSMSLLNTIFPLVS